MKKQITIALIGQPNVGKSSIINKISGTNLKVGNFAGVTIEKAQTQITHKGYELTIIDLPGAYSLSQHSPEEKIAQDFLAQGEYDIILNIVDSTSLERNLSLSTQVLAYQTKTLLALNMDDEAQKEGIEIDSKLLSETLGVPSLKVSAKSKSDMQRLLDALIELHQSSCTPSYKIYDDRIEQAIEEITPLLSSRPQALSLLQQGTHLKTPLANTDDATQAKITQIINELEGHFKKSLHEMFILTHLKTAKNLALKVQSQTKPQNSKGADSILLNQYLGIPIFLALMWILFQATFTLGEIPKSAIEEGFTLLSEWLKTHISSPSIASLLSDGIIGGVGAVISFLPEILILFFGIVLLESTGYMARIAFLLDGFFHRFGLHGKSFIPLVTGFGCSVPAFMSTRMLKNRSDKLLTLFVINFMSCSARLPVYILFIGAFFPAEQSGNILFGIYLFGALIGLLMAKLLKLTAFKHIDEPFVMEMPKYRLPSINFVALSVWNKAKMYLKKAGGFILIASVAIWFASSYPEDQTIINDYESRKEALQTQQVDETRLESLANEEGAELLQRTYLGRFGDFISPVFSPFDFDWKLSVALVTGVAAKEVMISTLGVLYTLGEGINEESQSLMDKLKDSISIPSAIAFLMFVMFYNPCFAATIVFGREAGGWKYVAYLFAFTSLVAYGFALFGFYGARLLGL